MGAPMAKIERALLMVVVGLCAPVFGHAEKTVVDTAKSERQAAPPKPTRAGPQATPPHAPRAGPQATPPRAPQAGPQATAALPSDKGAPRSTDRVDARRPESGTTSRSPRIGANPSRAAATTGITPSVTAVAGSSASTAAAPTQNGPAVARGHFIPNVPKTANVSDAPGTIGGRRAADRAVIGGAAKYDAKHGAVIGGTVTGRKR